MKSKFTKYWFFFILTLAPIIVLAQYQSIPVKEEYDLYNADEVSEHEICIVGPNDYFSENCPDHDGCLFGDGMSKVLEGYIAMYKATGDKAYLYKFILQSLCIVENRHDYASVNSEPRWSHDPSMYQDGYIIAAFSRFIYFIKLEEPSLFNEPIYQFDQLIPSNYAANTCNCNKFGITFSTFGQYANWLQDRVGETMWWFLTNGYWSDSWGFLQTPGSNATGVSINMQIGFGRALLFIGLTAGEQSFLDKAEFIANLFKSNVYFFDPCEDQFYNANVLRLTGDNSYWWYHAGWSVLKRDCGVWTWFPPSYTYYFKVPKYSGFVQYIEDISHGAIVTWLPLDFYNFQPNTPFTTDDMIRFRNMFTKHIYYGAGGFHEAVNGHDVPVATSGQLDVRALNYMLFADFDGADATATSPDVYDIVLEYYINNIQGNIASPYFGQDNKGHAEIVQAQWKRECPDLTLYNRKVVYDQNFFAKGNMTIDGAAGPTSEPYANPTDFTDDKFVIEPGTTVNISSGERISIKNFHAKAGSNVHIFIDPTLCNSKTKSKTGNLDENNGKKNFTKAQTDISSATETKPEKDKPDTYLFDNSIMVNPNPFTDYALIQFSLQKASTVTLTVYDSFGRPVFNQITNRQLSQGIYNIPFSGSSLATGMYHCVLTIGNETRLTKTIVKK